MLLLGEGAQAKNFEKVRATRLKFEIETHPDDTKQRNPRRRLPRFPSKDQHIGEIFEASNQVPFARAMLFLS